MTSMNLQDVRAKGIMLDLDKPRRLKFTLNSFAELEDRFGSIDEAMESLQKGSIKSMRTLLWAGLMHEDPTLTETQVGDLFGIGDLEKLAEAIGQAMGESMPKTDAPRANTVQVPGNPKPSQ